MCFKKNIVFVSGNDITYQLPTGTVLFSGLSFQFGLAKYGLVGPNGIGKSTLLKIINGDICQSHGYCFSPNRIGILPQHPNVHPGITVGDLLGIGNIIQAIKEVRSGCCDPSLLEIIGDRWDVEEQVTPTLKQFGLAPSILIRKFCQLSAGEKTKVYLASLLIRRPDFLLLDEPTNNLDAHSKQMVFRCVQSWKKGLLVVSHDRQLLSLVDEIWELSNLGLRRYGGNFEMYKQQREVEQTAASETLKNATLLLKKAAAESRVSKQRQQKRMTGGNKKAKATGIPKVARGNMKRRGQKTLAKIYSTHQKKISALADRIKTLKSTLRSENQIQIDLPQTTVPNGKRVVSLSNVNIAFTEGQYLWHQDINAELSGPAKVHLKGDNGVGKSTLLGALYGTMPPRFVTGYSNVFVPVRNLDQHLSVLNDSQTIIDNMRTVAPTLKEHDIRFRLSWFLFLQQDSQKTCAKPKWGRATQGRTCLRTVL